MCHMLGHSSHAQRPSMSQRSQVEQLILLQDRTRQVCKGNPSATPVGHCLMLTSFYLCSLKRRMKLRRLHPYRLWPHRIRPSLQELQLVYARPLLQGRSKAVIHDSDTQCIRFIEYYDYILLCGVFEESAVQGSSIARFSPCPNMLKSNFGFRYMFQCGCLERSSKGMCSTLGEGTLLWKIDLVFRDPTRIVCWCMPGLASTMCCLGKQDC